MVFDRINGVGLHGLEHDWFVMCLNFWSLSGLKGSCVINLVGGVFTIIVIQVFHL